MALKTCPRCGSEYVPTVTLCPDCNVPLVEEVEADPFADETEPEVGYDVGDWIPEAIDELRRDLESAEIPYLIRDGELVVNKVDETETDVVVDLVQRRTLATLDADAPKVAYDVDDLDDDQSEALMARLTAQGIPFEFDLDDALVVLEVDGSRVEEALDAVEFPDALAPDARTLPEALGEDGSAEGGGSDAGTDGEADDSADDDADDDVAGDDVDWDDIDAGEVLADLFVAADRLMHKASDPEGVLGLVDNANLAERMPLPFGFPPGMWRDLLGEIRGLRDLLESDRSTDEEIEETARALRETLRPMV